MPIDPRLVALGYKRAGQALVGHKKRLFITMDGITLTGKTRFLRSCPGPQVCIQLLERGMEGVAEYDLWGNEIGQLYIDMPSLDQGGKTASPTERAKAMDSYTRFKQLVLSTFQALGSIGGGTLSIETGGGAYAMAQIARFGQIAQLGEVSAALWTSMQAEFQGIFLQYEDYPVNLIVTHRQGSKFGGAAGETDLKGYKEMQFLSQVHLEFQRVYRLGKNGARLRWDNGGEQFDLVRKVTKCRQRLSLTGTEFPVIFLDDAGQMSSTPTEQSIGGDFETIALACFPDSQREDWF